MNNNQKQTDYTIDADKPILMSPINYIDFTGNKQKATEEIDIIEDLNVFVDDELISDQCVRASANWGHRLASDGYWLLLNLEKGKHRIISYSSCRSGTITMPLEYNLTLC